MIILDVEQNTPEWFDARLGIPTASRFSEIVTPLGKLSAQSRGYRYQLLGEWLAGETEESYQSGPMATGFMRQPEALRWYEMQTGHDVREVGFILPDERRLVGCSPDGLVGATGGLEIKCPGYKAHVETLMTGAFPDRYYPQVQGGLWIAEREWWDFVSYHPGLPSSLVRVPRDDGYIAKLSEAVGEFVDLMMEDRETLLRRGFRPAREIPDAAATAG